MGRILVVRGGAIGDFILTIPAIQLVRDSLPDPHIAVLGYRNVVDVAVEFGVVDEARSIEYGPMAKFFIPGAELDEELAAWVGSFDLVVSYLYDPDGYFAGNVEKCNVDTYLPAIHKVTDDPEDGHAASQLARPLEQLAMFLESPAPRLNVSEASPVDELVDEVAGDQRIVALHPGSGSPQKNWGIERWSRVCRTLHSEYENLRIALVSGEAEEELADELVSLLEESKIPTVRWHNRPLPELAKVLSQCALFLGHDSGMTHLAGACGAPVVALFGPTNPSIWAPQNERVHVVVAGETPGKMEHIREDDVSRAALDALSRQH